LTRLSQRLIADIVPAAVAAIQLANEAVLVRIAFVITAIGLIHASTVLAEVVLLAFAARPTAVVGAARLGPAVFDTLADLSISAREPLGAVSAVHTAPSWVSSALDSGAGATNTQRVDAFLTAWAVTAIARRELSAFPFAHAGTLLRAVDKLQGEVDGIVIDLNRVVRLCPVQPDLSVTVGFRGFHLFRVHRVVPTDTVCDVASPRLVRTLAGNLQHDLVAPFGRSEVEIGAFPVIEFAIPDLGFSIFIVIVERNIAASRTTQIPLQFDVVDRGRRRAVTVQPAFAVIATPTGFVAVAHSVSANRSTRAAVLGTRRAILVTIAHAVVAPRLKRNASSTVLASVHARNTDLLKPAWVRRLVRDDPRPEIPVAPLVFTGAVLVLDPKPDIGSTRRSPGAKVLLLHVQLTGSRRRFIVTSAAAGT